MITNTDNIPGRIAEAIFPGRRVRRLKINLEVGTLATVEAEIYCGDELRTVLGVIGDRPAWRFVEEEHARLRLTDAEREAICYAAGSLEHLPWYQKTLRGLLERLK